MKANNISVDNNQKNLEKINQLLDHCDVVPDYIHVEIQKIQDDEKAKAEQQVEVWQM